MHHIFMFMPVLSLALFFFFPWQWALPSYLPIAIGSLIIAYKAMQAQFQPPASGREAMVGNKAIAVSTEKGKVKVRYQGEIWNAHSKIPLNYGQQVMIESVIGLKLQVIPCPVKNQTLYSVQTFKARE